MLRNIFPVEKSLQASGLNPSSFSTHDDLISIIYVESEQIERSILFQCLVTNNREGRSIIYITREPFEDLPGHVEDMPSVDAQNMDVVTFVYINSAQQLTSYLAELHTLRILPNVLIIQNISFYISQYKGDSFNTKFTRLLALVKESAKFLATKFERVGEAKLFISMRSCEEDQSILKRHFKNVWFINETSTPSEYMIKLQKVSALAPESLLFTFMVGNISNPRFIRCS